MFESNKKSVIFSPDKNEVYQSGYNPNGSQQKNRQVFGDSGVNSYNGSFNAQYPQQDRAAMYRSEPINERGSRPMMREVKILNLEDVSPSYQNEQQQQQRSIFTEAPMNQQYQQQQQQYPSSNIQQAGSGRPSYNQPINANANMNANVNVNVNLQQQQQQQQQPGVMKNPYFDNRYAGVGNADQGSLDARSVRPSNYASPQKQGGSPQKYHKVTVGMEGYEYENPDSKQGGAKIFGSEPKQNWRFGNSTFQYGAPTDQPLSQSQPNSQQNIPLYQQGKQPNGLNNINPQQRPGDSFVTPRGTQGGENMTRSSPNGVNIAGSPGVDQRGTLPIQGKVPEGKSNVAQRPYAILKNLDDTALLPKQEGIVFEGPERYTVNSDFYAALFKKGEYLLELIRNQRVVILNCQQAIKSFNHQKESSLKNLIRLESEFMQGQGTDDSGKSGQQVKKIESLAAEIENCKKLAQDAEKLEDFFKRSIITRATKKNIPELETEIISTSDRIVKESNALEEHLRLMREFRKENSNSTRFEQKANQVLTDLNWHKDIYLESWNRIHNMFIVLADYFHMQIPELSQVAKKYNDVFNLSAYQSEIKVMDQYQSRLNEIKKQLSETATILGGIFQAKDTSEPYIVITKRDGHQKFIQDKKKVLELLRNNIKAFKFEIKSYRDPTNSKSLASQKVKTKISDNLAEEVKQVGYKCDNLLVVCDVFVEVEKEQLLSKELYDSAALTRSQTKLFKEAEDIIAKAEKGSIDKIALSVDKTCAGFNHLIADYLQMKNRLIEHSGNPEVQIILGSVLRDSIKKIDAQLVKCSQMNEKIFKLRYLGSKIESQLDELKIETFQADYDRFMNDLKNSYQTIDTFIQNQKNREVQQSACRKKIEKLRDLEEKQVEKTGGDKKDAAKQQVHEKTVEKIKKSKEILGVYDENFSTIDECMAACDKAKVAIEFLSTTTVKDFESGMVRSILKDEGDILNQASQYAKSVESKTAKEYETTKLILNYYTPLFAAVYQIFKLIENFFYDKDGVSIYIGGANQYTPAGFRAFTANVQQHGEKFTDKNLQDKLKACILLWEQHVGSQFGADYR